MTPPNIAFDSSAEGVSGGGSDRNSFSSAITTSSRSGDEQCAGGSKLFLGYGGKSRPLNSSQELLPSGPITLRLVPDFHRPTLEHCSLASTFFDCAGECWIDAREYQINCLAIKVVLDCLESIRYGVRLISRSKANP